MAAKACMEHQKPIEDFKPYVGQAIQVSFRIRNCGDEEGIFYFRYFVDDVVLGARWDYPLTPGATPGTLLDWVPNGMPNHPITIKFEAGHLLNEAWTTDYEDEVTLTPRGVEPEPKGKIIAHNINKLPCPDCGSAKVGQEIEVIMGMKNIGDTEEEFRFYIYDQDGNELSKEPDFTYKNVKAGDTWGVSKTLLTNLNFKMLNKTLNGRVELRREK